MNSMIQHVIAQLARVPREASNPLEFFPYSYASPFPPLFSWRELGDQFRH